MDHFTLDELASFSKNSSGMNKIASLEAPSEKSVNAILAYSAALSVRKSKRLQNITMMLN